MRSEHAPMGDGECCCNCMRQVKLFKHPETKAPFRGSVMEETGFFACLLHGQMDNNKNAVIFDTEHSVCEMWYPMEPKQ